MKRLILAPSIMFLLFVGYYIQTKGIGNNKTINLNELESLPTDAEWKTAALPTEDEWKAAALPTEEEWKKAAAIDINLIVKDKKSNR